MKFIHKLLLIVPVILISTTGCEKMLDENSDRFIKTDDYTLNQPKDAIYAMSGILTQMQKLGERYVLLGELRGDLMEVTNDADLYLKQINNYEVASDNPYTSIKEYYALINNCNYLIAHIDTGVVAQGKKALLPIYAAAKTYRAWTYMQIALNFGKAVYYEKPLLTVEDAAKEYPAYNITELANVLIPDLMPLKDIPYPDLGTIGELSSNSFYFPVRFLMGELYLWSGQYEMAAQEYYGLLNKEKLAVNTFRSGWDVVNGTFINWHYTYYFSETISCIGTTSEHGEGCHLQQLSLIPSSSGSGGINKVMIKSSDLAVKNWEDQIYYDVNPLNQINGDLRGENWSYLTGHQTISLHGKFYEFDADNYIIRYIPYNQKYQNSEIIPTCKVGLVYLRYAEAMNRLGKPNLAFAVLKNGLTKQSMANSSIIPASEIPSPKPAYMNFDTTWFNDHYNENKDFVPGNKGIHANGCGYVQNVTSYIIPSLASKDDSIAYVEDLIKTELALETAFDGNRFHDLMRIALRRNDPSYLADAVAEKFAGNKEFIRSKLKDMKNWYLPVK